MLYIGMSGAKETLLAQATAANNLANATTTGFRADLAQARSMPVFGPGYPSRAFAQSERPGYDLQPASLQTTGRDLDVAIHGDGWLAVQDGQGNEAYSRRGDLQLTVNGMLVNGAGRPVLGNGGPVAIPPAESVEIAADGTISVRPVGSDANTLVQIDRLKLVNPPPREMEKGEDGLFRQRDAAGPAEADAFVRVVSGALEASNVNAVEEMVDMIHLARKFEMQVKVMSTAQENDDRTTQLLRLS
jgi:flagellar basal-body rod protein FlgF